MSQSSIQQAFQIALGHHQAGRLAEAETAYGQILAEQPRHADTLHCLGVLCYQSGRASIAVQLIRQSLAIDPRNASAFCNLGNALRDESQLDESIAACRQAIALKPELAAAHNNLGNALQDKGQLEEAIAAIRQAIRLEPRDANMFNNLGNAQKANGQLDDAILSYRQAISLAPQQAKAYNYLGHALQVKGLLEESIAAYQKAISVAPGNADSYNNLGNAFSLKSFWDHAIAAYRQAIALKPQYPQAYNNLGGALKETGQIEEAIAACRQAIALNPNFSEAHNNLGRALMQAGQLEEAIAAYRQAIALNPEDATTHSNLLFMIHYLPQYDAPAIARETAVWSSRHAEPLRQFIRPHTNDRDPSRKLRIGLVSPDFRDHAVARTLLLPLLDNYDKSQIEMIAYAQVLSPDPITHRLRTLVDQWRSTVGLSDAQAADLIRQDKIDVLVDVAFHTARNRLLVFAHKPAPVQVTWFPSTTSMRAIDYRLTDRHIDPPGADEPYTEQSIRLKSFWCFQPEQTPKVNPLPALQSGHMTFGSLNNFAKINPDVLKVWLEIMQSVPNSRLLLKSNPGRHQNSVHEFFLAGGIARDRIDFVGALPEQEYLRLYHRIDLGLDPFPFNGHTTTFDFLWMGVPVITLAGKSGVGRAGVSALSNIGLPNLIAQTKDEYYEHAVRLANDLSALAVLRANLREKMRASPLMDAPGYARDIEAAFRKIWRTWCDKS